MRINRGVLRDYRLLLSIAIPLSAGSLSGILTGLVDTALLGRYGDDVATTLAGAGIGIQISLGLTIVTVSSMLGQAVLTAHSFGARHPRRAGVVLWHSAVLYLTLGFALAVTLNLLAPQVANIFTDSAAVAENAVSYIRVSTYGIPLFIGHFLLVNVFTADRKPLYPLLGSIVIGVVNVGLSYPLIYGLGFIPELGVTGSALGSVCAEAASFLVLLFIFVHKRYPQRIRPTSFRLSLRFMRSLIWLSAPTLLSVLFLQVGEFNVLRVAGQLGDSELAAVRIVSIVVFSTFALMYGFAQTGQVMAGRLVGAGDWAGVKRLYRRNWELLLIVYAPLFVLYVSAPTVVLGVTTSEGSLTELGALPMRIAAGTLVGVTWTLNTVVFIRGLGKTQWDLIMNGISAVVVQIPLAYVLALTLGWGLVGLYVSTLLFWLVRGCIGFGLLMSLFRKDSYTLQPATTLAEVFVDD